MCYNPKKDKVYCFVRPIFSRHNWQLPLHRLPVNDGSTRLQIFACSLLKGDVLPCFNEAREFLSLSPSVVLRPLVHRKAGDLLSGRSKFNFQPGSIKRCMESVSRFSLSCDQTCFKDRFHSQFGASWGKMHGEIRLEGEDLIPKGSKKVKGLLVSSIL